jgi:hypothetical protein
MLNFAYGVSPRALDRLDAAPTGILCRGQASGGRATRAAIARLARRPLQCRYLLVLAAMLATAFLLELASGIVDLRAEPLRTPCLKNDTIVDGKRRQPTPAFIAAREMAPGCQAKAGSGATTDEVEPALDRLGASLASQSRDQNRPMSGLPSN